MKTKNLILALVAIVFAVGSAFTSKNADLVNNVRIWMKQTSTSSFACTAIPRECNTSGSITCTVSVLKADLGVESVIAYSDASCTAPLKHNGPALLTYDAGAGERPFDVADTNN